MPDLNVQIRFEGRDVGLPKFAAKSMDIYSTGNAHDSKTLSIPTTAAGTAITFAATIGTLGWCRFENLADPVATPTQYVEFGRQVAGVFYGVFKVNPGQAIALPISCTTSQLYGRANAATTDINLCAVED